MAWPVEMLAALAGAPLIWRLKDARQQAGTRTWRSELLIARLMFWLSFLLSFALPGAIAWVFMMGFGMMSRGGDGVGKPRELRPEAEVLAQASTIEQRIESARALGIGAVRRGRPDRLE